MKKSTLLIMAIICFFSFIQMDCTDELVKPCSDCPPPVKDTIITFEKELCNGQMPAVSPDGSKIAYTFQGDIWLIDTAGIQTVIWVDSLQYPWIWHTDTTAGKPTQLTFGPEDDVMPRWNPNGQTIGFIRSIQGEYNKGLLFIVPVTGGGATQLVFNQFIADSMIQQSRRIFGSDICIPIWEWSPNGKYASFFSINGFETNLKIVSLTEGILIFERKIHEYNISSNNRSFVWSSVPNEIVFIAGDAQKPNGQLYLVNIKTNEQKVDSSQFRYSFVTHLPQSRYFAYGTTLGPPKIVVTDFKETKNEFKASSYLNLKCSPDEKYFLYEWSGAMGGPFGYEYSQLYIYDIARKKEYQLTNNGDNDLHNYFFEWGNNSQTVFFERFNKINKKTFRF